MMLRELTLTKSSRGRALPGCKKPEIAIGLLKKNRDMKMISVFSPATPITYGRLQAALTKTRNFAGQKALKTTLPLHCSQTLFLLPHLLNLRFMKTDLLLRFLGKTPFLGTAPPADLSIKSVLREMMGCKRNSPRPQNSQRALSSAETKKRGKETSKKSLGKSLLGGTQAILTEFLIGRRLLAGKRLFL